MTTQMNIEQGRPTSQIDLMKMEALDSIDDILALSDPTQMDNLIFKNTINISKILRIFYKKLCDNFHITKEESDLLIYCLKFIDTLNLFMINQSISSLLKIIYDINEIVSMINTLENKETILKKIKYTDMTVIYYRKKLFKSLFFGDGFVLGKEIENALDLVSQSGNFDQRLFKQMQNIFYVVQSKIEEGKRKEIQQRFNEMKVVSQKSKKNKYNYYEDYDDYADYKNYSHTENINYHDYYDYFNNDFGMQMQMQAMFNHTQSSGHPYHGNVHGNFNTNSNSNSHYYPGLYANYHNYMINNQKGGNVNIYQNHTHNYGSGNKSSKSNKSNSKHIDKRRGSYDYKIKHPNYNTSNANNTNNANSHVNPDKDVEVISTVIQSNQKQNAQNYYNNFADTVTPVKKNKNKSKKNRTMSTEENTQTSLSLNNQSKKQSENSNQTQTDNTTTKGNEINKEENKAITEKELTIVNSEPSKPSNTNDDFEVITVPFNNRKNTYSSYSKYSNYNTCYGHNGIKSYKNESDFQSGKVNSQSAKSSKKKVTYNSYNYHQNYKCTTNTKDAYSQNQMRHEFVDYKNNNRTSKISEKNEIKNDEIKESCTPLSVENPSQEEEFTSKNKEAVIEDKMDEYNDLRADKTTDSPSKKAFVGIDIEKMFQISNEEEKKVEEIEIEKALIAPPDNNLNIAPEKGDANIHSEEEDFEEDIEDVEDDLMDHDIENEKNKIEEEDEEESDSEENDLINEEFDKFIRESKMIAMTKTYNEDNDYVDMEVNTKNNKIIFEDDQGEGKETEIKPEKSGVTASGEAAKEQEQNSNINIAEKKEEIIIEENIKENQTKLDSLKESTRGFMESLKTIDPKVLLEIKNKLNEEGKKIDNASNNDENANFNSKIWSNNNIFPGINSEDYNAVYTNHPRIMNTKVPLHNYVFSNYAHFFYRGRDSNIHREYFALKCLEQENSNIITKNIEAFENRILVPIYQRINFNVNKKRGVYFYTFTKYKKLIYRVLGKDKILKKVKPYGSYMNNFLIDSGDIDICIVPKCGILEFSTYLEKIKEEIIGQVRFNFTFNQ